MADTMTLILEDLDITTPNGRRLITSVNARFNASVTALVGQNGAGKSTLLRAIANLHPFVRGTIRLDALDNVRHKRTFLERLAFMPQNFMS